jgi:hypothetical protein
LVKEGKKKAEDYPAQLQAIKNLYDSNVSKSIPTPELIIIDGLIHLSPSKRREKKAKKKSVASGTPLLAERRR